MQCLLSRKHLASGVRESKSHCSSRGDAGGRRHRGSEGVSQHLCVPPPMDSLALLMSSLAWEPERAWSLKPHWGCKQLSASWRSNEPQSIHNKPPKSTRSRVTLMVPAPLVGTAPTRSPTHTVALEPAESAVRNATSIPTWLFILS